MRFFSKLKNSIQIYIKNTDKLLILLCTLASLYGLALVYSTTVTAGRSMRDVVVQLAAFILGMVVAIFISQIDYEAICTLWPIWAGASLILMILTYIGGIGLNAVGTDDTAWLEIFGISFQPSELMKIVFIVTFAKHLSLVRDHINELKTVLLLCLHGGLPIALVFKQGDDGTALVFILMFVSMMFAAGLKPLYFLIALTGGCAILPFIWDKLIKEKMGRILCLFFVDEYLSEEGWQQYEGLVATGSGQLWGKGFLGGQKDFFARNNDMIFTVAGEEFGFIGAVVLLALLLLIVWELWRCAITARDRLGMYICIGVMSLIGFQSLINIGMNLRVLPVIGITLPFISAGGSSSATLYLGIGLALSVYFSSRARVRNTIFSKPL